MIKEVHLKRWKSFGDAVLYIDPLTVLIGANAGGKSNALDSFRFLQRIASGKDLTSALSGEIGQPGIRGGLEWAALKPYTSFEINVLLNGSDDGIEYQYSLEGEIKGKEIKGKCELLSESLVRIKHRPKTKNHPYKIHLFRTDPVNSDDPAITARLYNEKKGTKKILNRSTSILSQLQFAKLSLRKEIAEGIEQVTQALRSIFVLDPIPSHMRSYSPLSEQLLPDAQNIAGVIAALPDSKRERIQNTLTEYVRHVPERDIHQIWAEPVGQFKSDAMLYCEEQWGEQGQSSIVDARGMSDGTLRFLAILTALLTLPERSLLVVEEVDNGLHPSRSSLLIKMLREVGTQRDIDVLVTTHNPALLNELGPEMLPFVVVAHRDPGTGLSKLTLLETIEQLPKLLASGPLGKLSAENKIHDALDHMLEQHS